MESLRQKKNLPIFVARRLLSNQALGFGACQMGKDPTRRCCWFATNR